MKMNQSFRFDSNVSGFIPLLLSLLIYFSGEDYSLVGFTLSQKENSDGIYDIKLWEPFCLSFYNFFL